MSALIIKKINSYEYSLEEDIEVSSLGLTIKVKKGFVFDGASIPKIFWGIVGSPFTGNYTLSALVHDALYVTESLERKAADEIFLDLMKQGNVSYLKRHTMYWAVRTGGYFVWKKHTEESIERNKKYIEIREVKR